MPHERTTPRGRGLWALALLLATVPAWGAAPHVKSRWTTGDDVALDGVVDEWDADAWTWIKHAKLDVGVMNDGSFLYLSFVTRDPGVRRQLLMQGLTVWLDPEGGEAASFGVHYPIGLRAGGSPEERRMPDPEEMRGAVDAMLQEFEVLEPFDLEPDRIEVDEPSDVAVAFGTIGERTVYELRIPLAASGAEPWVLDAAAGQRIAIHLDSPKPERPKGDFRGGFGGPGGGGRGGGGPGGFGGPGGGRGGPEGGRGGPPGGAFPELHPLDLWIAIDLAQPAGEK